MARTPTHTTAAWVGVQCLVLTLSCSNTSEQPSQTFATGPLKQGSAARVANTEVPLAVVADVARARKVSPHDAATLLVEDALLAQAAREQKLDADLHVVAKIRAVDARTSINRLLAQQPDTRASDEEVAEMTKELWAQVDRGEARRTTHAIVLDPKLVKSPAVPDTPEGNARRQALAEKIRDAVAVATTPAEFTAIVEKIPAEGLDVKVEPLPPIVADGRGFDGNAFDQDFAAGVFAIPADQRISAVIKSKFGWHVALVTERLPPVHQSLEERRALASRILAEQRVKAAYEAHVEALKKDHTVEISSAAESLLTSALSAPTP